MTGIIISATIASINLSIDMINGGVSREQVARYLAVLTATVILTTLIGKICFTEDTLIKTEDGYKEIQDIEVGDLPIKSDRYLNSFANIFIVWDWDMEVPTDLFVYLVVW